MDRDLNEEKRRRRRRRELGSTKQDWFGSSTATLPSPATDDEDWRKARREARRKIRAKRRRRGYTVLAAVFSILGISLFINLASEEPVRTVVTPVVESAVFPPKLESSGPADKGSASTPAINDEAEPDLAGDPAALRERIKKIANYYGGTYGVVVYDPRTNEKVSIGEDETFFAASLGKLPTLLSLYQSAAAGEVNLDAVISMYPSDVQSYGTGVLHNRPLGSTFTLRECAYYLINQSDNTAWSMLTRYLGIGEIQADTSNIGALDTAYWAPNTTTPQDVLLMLKKIADPSYTSEGLSNEMLDSMTDTEFEDRIPAGLPPDVRVAHKIGSYESSFSDAGIVFYEGPGGEKRHYYVVTLIAGVGEATARAAIQEISAAAHATFAVSGDQVLNR